MCGCLTVPAPFVERIRLRVLFEQRRVKSAVGPWDGGAVMRVCVALEMAPGSEESTSSSVHSSCSFCIHFLFALGLSFLKISLMPVRYVKL